MEQDQFRSDEFQHNILEAAIPDPNGRLKALSDYGNSVEIDNNIPPRRYYRSGLEMVRMANVYLEEGSLENAYILYMKFMTLFIEKIRHHPDFGQVSVSDRAVNAQKLREVLPKAEKLKTRLLDQYTREYSRYHEERKVREQKEQERRKKAEEEMKMRKQVEITPHPPQQKGVPDSSSSIVVLPSVPTDNVIYPDTLEPEKPTFIPKPDSLSIGSPKKLSVPSVDRNTKPASLLSPSIHSKVGLRNVVVPSRLMGKFMNLAQRNTLQNIETCGILAGTLTHPTQTAFLSSVDLHTHCSYQLMMPEALAIVCAPRYQENGFFILTPHYGLDFIASCRQTGFHPHPTEPPLYMKAEHTKLDNAACVEVVDLRR
ncbi:STAM-binding protein [Blattella germanica]|nr:STAM-binding protein [Blattella germanica]